jgi:hypothetical protein
MARFAQVRHQLWIAAPAETVRAQFADLQHHIDANVHPKLHFQILAQTPTSARYLQEVRLLGIRQRDMFMREFASDGTMTDTSVEGFNKGGSLSFRFHPQTDEGRIGTRVEITVRLPLPPVVGPLIRRLLEAQVRREVEAASLEDKHDIEVRGYVPQPVTGLKLAA